MRTEPRPDHPPLPGDAARVLVVDDDSVTRALVRNGLRKCCPAADVLDAADGESARAILREQEVDLVITDVLMPGIDGLALIREERARRPDTVWIILSGVDAFDTAVQAIQVGAFDFLTKPVRLQELEVSVRNALDHRRLVRERTRLFHDLEEANRALLEKVRQLEDKSEMIRRDLSRAEVIQRALLPSAPPPLDGWRVNAVYRPGRYVGGDFYAVFPVGDRHLAAYIADATGHGVASAMLSVLFHRRLEPRDERGGPRPPGRVLEDVNQSLCADAVAPGLFLTAAYVLVDLEKEQATIASAGHPPVLSRAGGRVSRVDRTGPALGLSPEARYDERTVPLARRDGLLLFTDGALGTGNHARRLRRLEQVIRYDDDDDHAAILEMLRRDAAEANGADDRDDVTVLIVEATPGESRFDNGAADPGGPAAPRPPRRAGKDPTLLYGETADECCLGVRGRATWTDADAFHETARGILDAGRPLAVDLSRCDYLDSTFLGTVHELVTGTGPAAKHLRLCGARDELRKAFEELSMSQVLAALDEDEPPPDAELQPLTAPATGDRAQLRLLRAHEALAALSARNEEKFRKVVEAMREQLEATED